MPKDTLNSLDAADAVVVRTPITNEGCNAEGIYTIRCVDKDGNLKWEEVAKNLVVTEGRNLALDTFLSGSSYTVTGPFMGLISSVGFSAISAGDTAAQINGSNGWKEAGSSNNFPLYTAPRKTCVWSAATGASKSLSANLTFNIVTTGGTIKGCFIIFGPGASSTIADTNGILWSVVLFSSGDKTVSPGDTVQATYSTSL